MAVTLTVTQFSVGIRLTVSGAPDTSELAKATDLLASVKGEIEEYANREGCPDAVHNNAAREYGSYLWDEEDRRQRSHDPFGNSGVKARLSRWHVLATATVT